MIYFLIPVYQPSELFHELVDSLKNNGEVVIVDDGTSAELKPRLSQVSGKILVHLSNEGKGAALKTGFAYLLTLPDFEGVVTVDADGQHSISDCKNMMKMGSESSISAIIGIRNFRGKIPLRSKVGNLVSKYVFGLFVDLPLPDTQCGLRFFSADCVKQLTKVPGSRYDFETACLIEIKKKFIEFEMMPVETLYLDENKSSHFRPFRDSCLIYKQIFEFKVVGIICYLLEILLFILFQSFSTPSISYFLSRASSACLNFFLSSKVFNRSSSLSSTHVLRYGALVGFNILVGSSVLRLVQDDNTSSLVPKLLLDIVLFGFNFFVSKKLVFKK